MSAQIHLTQVFRILTFQVGTKKPQLPESPSSTKNWSASQYQYKDPLLWLHFVEVSQQMSNFVRRDLSVFKDVQLSQNCYKELSVSPCCLCNSRVGHQYVVNRRQNFILHLQNSSRYERVEIYALHSYEKHQNLISNLSDNILNVLKELFHKWKVVKLDLMYQVIGIPCMSLGVFSCFVFV